MGTSSAEVLTPGANSIRRFLFIQVVPVHGIGGVVAGEFLYLGE